MKPGEIDYVTRSRIEVTVFGDLKDDRFLMCSETRMTWRFFALETNVCIIYVYIHMICMYSIDMHMYIYIFF